MPNITLSVSNEMKERMDNFSEVSWSDVCRSAIQAYLEEREKDTKVSDSKDLKVIAYIDPLLRRRENKLVYILRIKNNEVFDIILDRTIFGVEFKIEEEKIEQNDHPLFQFNMINIASNEIGLISTTDSLNDSFKQSLFDMYDKGTKIKWIIFGDIYYRSKTEIYKSGFYIEGTLNDNSKGFIRDQMRI